MRIRLGLGGFTTDDRERLAEAIDDLAMPADAAVREILGRPYAD
jgi:protein-disulfide isomerase-like protein with CxxC motif